MGGQAFPSRLGRLEGSLALRKRLTAHLLRQ